jgi:glutamate dehydrogenase
VAEIAADLPRLLVAEERQGLRRQAKALAKKGVPAALAGQVAGLGQLPSALDIVEVAGENGVDVKSVAHLYFHLGDALETWWLRQHIAALPQQNYWQARARTALRDELLEQQAALTMATLALARAEESTAARLRAWKQCCEPYLGRWEQVLGELKVATRVSYEMLAVAVQELRELVSACQPGTDQACEVVQEAEPDPGGDD